MSDPTATKKDHALKQAAIVIRTLKDRISHLERDASRASEPIAIVGIGCRFPGGADGPAAFWRLLDEGRDAVTATDARWARIGARPAEGVPRWAGLLTEPIDRFDPAFFGISPREAVTMDPQQRLLLEVLWEALEDAGVPPPTLDKSRTGVFIGASVVDYADTIAHEPAADKDAYSVTGTMLSIAAGRLSYTLGLQGPCMAVDTACSSSLVAAHLACQSLRRGETDLALVGGVNLLLSSETMEGLARTQALSPDGRCRAFDAAANGFVRGEGCGFVVLARCSDARRAGHRIWAQIRGSAVNQDGRSTGLTAPNVLAQQALLRDALRDAGVEAREIDFVETHGTGTSLGDPIEFEALRGAIGAFRPEGNPCVLGALKTNIGHLEAAAGVAGLIKTALALAHERIPQNLNFRRLNPRIRQEGTALALATTPRPWPRTEHPRVAGVSSFGLSGTNAHIVLEEAPPTEPGPTAADRGAELFVLSGKTEAAVDAQAMRLHEHLRAHPLLAGSAVAHSLATTRAAFEHRLAIAARSREELLGALAEAASRRGAEGVVHGQVRPSKEALAFLFTGQGSQTLGMGRGLHAAWPAFAEAFDRCAALFDAELDRPLREVIWAEPGSHASTLLDRTGHAQPALFTLEYALYMLWRSWGIEPGFVAGHSIGELVAAHVAGVFSLEDAVRLVAARGRLMQALPSGGAMVSIAASEAEVSSAIGPHAARLSIAAINGPAQVVVSGEAAAVQEVVDGFAARGVRTKALRVSHAFHSPAMDPMLEDFRRVARSVRYDPPAIPLVSNLRGAIDPHAPASADYWVEHVREAVRFCDGIVAMHEAGVDTFVELGPRATLLGLVPGCLPEAQPSLHPSLRSGRDEAQTILTALGELWSRGCTVDWAGLFPQGGRRVALPTYAWQWGQFWVEPERAHASLGEAGSWPLAGLRIPTPGVEAHHVLRVGPHHQPYLDDHVIFGRLVVPGAFHLTVALAVASERWPDQPLELSAVEFVQALVVEPDGEAELHVLIQARSESEDHGFELSSCAATDGRWTVHVRGRVRPSTAEPSLASPAELDARARREIDLEGFLAKLSAQHIDWGPKWRWMERAHVGGEVAIAELSAPGSAARSAPLHPCLLDNGFGATTLWSVEREPNDDVPQLPFAVERLRWWRAPTGRGRCGTIARLAQGTDQSSVSDLVLWDETGTVVAEVEGFVSRRAPRSTFLRGDSQASADAFYRIDWQEAREGTDGEVAPLPGRWIVVAEAGSSRAARLATALERCVQVEPEQLEAALARHDEPAGVVCLWDARSTETVPQTALRVASEGLSIIAALREHPGTASRTWWVTSAAVDTGGEALTSAATASTWGLGRTVRREHPELGLVLVDLAAETSIDALLRELSRTDGEDQVALRGERRLLARLVRAATPPATDSAMPIRGAVLITGGLGSLGLQVARWLAERGASELVLVSRRAAGTAEVEAIASLQALGARVEIASVDVADRRALAALVHAHSGERPLRGIVHAAGVLDDGILAEQSAARFTQVFSPKVDGAWNLHELTAALELDFFVLFSSSAGLLGSAGQSNYAAANTFLDALAAQRRGRGLPAQSLAWGPWSTSGMAAELAEVQRARMARLGLRTLEPDRALFLLERALSRSERLLAPMSLDLEAVSRQQGTPASPLWRALLESPSVRATRSAGSGSWADRLVRLPAEQREVELRAGVQEEVARVLAMGSPKDVPVDRPLMDLGLDSLMAVELRNALARRIGASLPATLAFDHPTVVALAERLSRELPDSSPAVVEAPSRRPVVEVSDDDDAIAIIGIGCRFAGGITDPEGFWRLLQDGRDAITEVPAERWDIDALYDPDPDAPGKMTTRWGGFLPDLDRFEPEFFGIAPRAAPSIDPQQRLLLETTWEALERAGKTPEQLMGSSTGVYMGLCSNDYQQRATSRIEAIDAYSLLGTSHSAMVGRLSYWLGLHGPNMPIDTACSSSLVAVHLACQALRAKECSLAIAGGANVMLSPEVTVYFSRLRAMSPSGRCRTFSDDADGYVRSEGCGVVVLERLSDARRNGAPIVAIIRGSAVNQDGQSSGLTAPNGPAQEAVIRQALARARVAPAHVGYVEAHGTGTPLGDPIEVQALAATLGEGRAADEPVVVGSVKSNIGHAEGAAGIAGLIKAVLCLQHGQIPKSLHFSAPNRHIAWAELPVRVASEPMPFPLSKSGRRIAGVSSFGFSGTNAHVVLEQAPPVDDGPSAPERPAELVRLTAKTETALHAQAGRLLDHLRAHPELALGDLAHGFATTRVAMEERLAITATSRESLMAALEDAARGRSPHGAARGRAGAPDRLAFLFTGQGAQTLGMGLELHATWPAFREAFDRAVERLDRQLDQSLRAIMWAEPGSEQAKWLDRTAHTQPALFAFEYALYALWRSWGVEPDFLAGHSVGEIVAACVAGVFSLDDAARFIVARGRLMQALPEGGGMMAVAATEAEALEVIAPHAAQLSIAAVNGPEQVVLSGALEALESAAAVFESRQVRTRALRVSHAFHSPLMDPALAELRRVAESIDYQRPTIPLVGALHGRLVEHEPCTAEYWVRHAREPVRFADTIAALHQARVTTFMELGPMATLLGMVPEVLPHADVTLHASVRHGHGETHSALEALGGLWSCGTDLDEAGVFPHGGRRVPLPTYPWQRERYWLDVPAVDARLVHGAPREAGHPLLGDARVPANEARVRIWETSLALSRLPWLADHRVRGEVVFPGAGYLEIALAAGEQALGAGPIEAHAVTFVEPLALGEDDVVELQVVTMEEAPNNLRVQIASRPAGSGDDAWTVHARGKLRRRDGDQPPRLDTVAVCERLGDPLQHEEIYATLERGGLEYGPAFRGLLQSRRAPGEALGRVRLPEAAGSAAAHGIHPALLDACFHVMAGAFPDASASTWLPVEVGSIRLFRRPVGEVQCHVHDAHEHTGAQGHRRTAELTIVDGEGVLVAQISGFVAQRIQIQSDQPERWFLEPTWERAEPPAPTIEAGRFLLLGDPSGVGAELRMALERAGHAVVHATSAVDGPASPGCVTFDDRSADGVRTLLAQAFEGEPPHAVVHLRSLEGRASALDPGSTKAALVRGPHGVLHAAQALVSMDASDPPRLWVVTRAAQVTGGAVPVAVEQAPLLGLARTIMAEQPELRCTSIDLDPTPSSADATALRIELLGDDPELEVRWRAGARSVARIVHRAPATAPPEWIEPAAGRAFRLEIDTPGVLDGLVLRHVERRPPGPGEVEIAVEAAALNFIDVMKAMGIYPDPQGATALGGECAGRIVGLGQGVEGLALGQSVVAMAPSSFGSHVIAPIHGVVPRPEALGVEQAAAVPAAYMTAWYALVHLARVRAGERVLIHSATGGTGLAAVQVARHLGAEVFATAGTEDKRAWLRAQGIAHAMDSRSLDFAEQTLEATGGEGVDVVLNSLSGAAIEASLATLAPDGRFVEIGKTDIYADRALGLACFKKSLSLIAVDLAGFAVRRPERLAALMREVMELFAAKTLVPPMVECFPAERAADAYRKMAQAKHMGKLVLTFGDEETPIHVRPPPRVEFRADRSYLVTGGLGGLGTSVAGWLADRGAGHIVLMSRSGANSEARRDAVQAIEARGARVIVEQADVASPSELAQVLDRIATSVAPLAGVVHTAGILDDGLLLDQTPARLDAVMAPKIQGALNLHAQTQGLVLDLFVLYGSVAGLIGSRGQAGYAAANAFLDALAHHRRALGLAALSIDWGAFSEVGMAAEQGRGVRLASRGLGSLTPAQGLLALEHLLDHDATQAAVIPLDVRAWSESDPTVTSMPQLSALWADQAPGQGLETEQEDLRRRLARAAPGDRRRIVGDLLRQIASHVLRIPGERIDMDAPLTSIGFDSLVGLELKQRLKRETTVNLPVARLLHDGSLARIAEHVLEQLPELSALPTEAEDEEAHEWLELEL
ncbi:type I polyketide synthase [Paraliomyxa miuraensis]|uniref:type I polyketide synthase n=1 Tax=Paraliomyxa miuraensis TaxID=376150 RepID=UPI002253949A|nr:type I polyketide synthase [Paraliomyxa miuraensis]MCX4246643.1 SDR family NAD(P)-dependent oxidoreductase [Paraliomyxa miuraensis]